MVSYQCSVKGGLGGGVYGPPTCTSCCFWPGAHPFSLLYFSVCEQLASGRVYEQGIGCSQLFSKKSMGKHLLHEDVKVKALRFNLSLRQ